MNQEKYIGMDVHQATISAAVNDMCEPRSEIKGPFSPKSIRNYTQCIMQVVASARDPKTGKRLYPREWDKEFLDRPNIGDQHTPSFMADEIRQVISCATPQLAVLYTLLAAGRLRINEAPGLKPGDLCDGTLTISRQIWQGKETSLKTRFAYRKVDLTLEVTQMLAAFIGDRKEGYIFRARNGSPLGDRNVLRDSLHPILKKLKLELRGFHAFRRYRVSYLRKQRTPEDLLRFWIGHGDKSVTDRYAKIGEDEMFRKSVAAEVGTGLSEKIFEEIAMIHPASPQLENFEALQVM